MKLKRKLGNIPKSLLDSAKKAGINVNAPAMLKPKHPADRLGVEYDLVHERIATDTKIINNLKTDIKAYAEEKGETYNKLRFVSGDNYEVGYVMVEPEPTIDVKKALKILPQGVYQKCKVVAIDKKLLEDCINRGEIPATVLPKILVQGASYKRIHVQRKKK